MTNDDRATPQDSVGLFVITLNVAMLSLMFWVFYEGGFDTDEFTTVLAIVAPMFACYATAATRHFTKERFARADNSKQVTAAFAVLSFVVPSVFAIAIIMTLVLQARGGTTHRGAFSNFEQFKRIPLIIQTGFSVYVGQLIYTLFTPSESTEGEASN